ncbi:hypothetical protein NP233_g8952 [Leucocoprinus birnbaumii]|uniref:H-type lectin domain-containing protein n=1 Tax=Leucocoprinus birnbaumii TaxID=56174 RepID=A0AAD5VL96_9AGAR|nr:hypothetical protein NP233_g8952 [Leucocoprinus birnbaumii]
MCSVSIFNTQNVPPWNQPRPDTFGQVNFPHPFLLPPALPQGVSGLDVSKGGDVRAMASVDYITGLSATYHLTALGNTTLYSSTVQSLGIAPIQV